MQVLVLLILPVLCSASHRRSGASGDVHWKETVKQMGAFRNVAAANAGGTGKVYVAERPFRSHRLDRLENLGAFEGEDISLAGSQTPSLDCG